MTIAERLRAIAAEVALLEAQTPVDPPIDPPDPTEPPPEPEPTPAPAPSPAPEPAPPAPDGPVYRAHTEQLFQPIAAGSIPSRLPGLRPMPLDIYGPTQDSVETVIGWQWANKGGDWIGADGVAQSMSSWSAPFTVDAVAEGESAGYEVDVTAALIAAQQRRIPFAIILHCIAPRQVDTRLGAVPPSLLLTDTDGAQHTLPALFTGPVRVGAPAQGLPTMALPAFMEFAKPADAPASAVLRFRAKTLARNSDPSGRILLVDTDRSLPTPRADGLDAGLLDEDIHAQPSIVGAHRYDDASPESDFIFADSRPAWQRNAGAEANYSPELWGGDPDTTKYPYIGAGKWLNGNGNTRVVRSAQIPHGPIAPGLGALCVSIPPDPQNVEGGLAAQPGWSICRLEMPLPADKMGLLSHLFVRQYFSWAPWDDEPDSLEPDDIKAVYQYPNSIGPAWASVGGKFGVVPTHDTNAGGFSGSSGGGDGWQMRLSCGFPVTGAQGPQMGSIDAAWHLYDFQALKNPLGKSSAGTRNPHGWGKVGGALYARRWYCVETELKLNSVDKPGVLPDGSPHLVNGVQQYWTADGELRAWINGRLTWEDTGLIFRTLPTKPRPSSADPRVVLYPIRELGIRSLMLNVYIGGTSPSAKAYRQYYAGLAYGSRYIGPMKGV